MMIHSLDLPPSDAEVDTWLALLTAAGAADQPQLPAPSRREIAGRLCVPPVRGRPVLWAADEGAGAAALLLLTEEGNTHTAFLDVLTVRPQERRRGVGTALWERVREELLAQGRTSVAAMVDLGGPGRRSRSRWGSRTSCRWAGTSRNSRPMGPRSSPPRPGTNCTPGTAWSPTPGRRPPPWPTGRWRTHRSETWTSGSRSGRRSGCTPSIS
ncbi:GNAT family N-acetyltransferase [Streptomyces sp. MS1.HAVA.3]|uniref:GNAT family N-acetyltransferase n=1 Tax=Streptomyces caledonius TaxID=3134107 RepID=A0ABU8U4D6_9ACTN